MGCEEEMEGRMIQRGVYFGKVLCDNYFYGNCQKEGELRVGKTE